MKWRNGPRNGNIEDRRGIHPFVRDTDVYRGDRQFDRVRAARYERYVKKHPNDPRGGIQRSSPEGADIPSFVRKRAEQLIAWKETPKPPPMPKPRPPRGRTRYTPTKR